MDDFQTSRLRLRLLRPPDEALYCALYTDPGVMARIGPPLSADAARRGFSAARRRNLDPAGPERRWAVHGRASGAAAGLFALLRDPRDRGDAEFGIMLLPSAQGRGFARELGAMAVSRAFAPDGWALHRLWARHAPGHAAAAGVLRAAGFRPGPPEGADATGVFTREDQR